MYQARGKAGNAIDKEASSKADTNQSMKDVPTSQGVVLGLDELMESKGYYRPSLKSSALRLNNVRASYSIKEI